MSEQRVPVLPPPLVSPEGYTLEDWYRYDSKTPACPPGDDDRLLGTVVLSLPGDPWGFLVPFRVYHDGNKFSAISRPPVQPKLRSGKVKSPNQRVRYLIAKGEDSAVWLAQRADPEFFKTM